MNALPAIAGGTPVRDTYLPYGQQWIEEEDIAAVVEVLKGDYLTTGPYIDQFEAKFADYVGAKYAVAIANGTAALHAAVFAAGLGAGDEVITTPITFAASANCVLYRGGKPVFADILPDTYNIDPKEVEKKINVHTKAIIPVHFTGQPVDIDPILELAKRHNLVVIEDAAHALGAEYKDRKIGAHSDMAIFSFHPVKHITTGEGGMITTNDEKLYQRLKQFRTHGITRDKARLHNDEGPWYYEMQMLGYNYRITDMQAALGNKQLEKIERFNRVRRQYVEMYNEGLKNIDGVVTPYVDPDCLSSWHIYVIQLQLEKLTVGRKEVFKALQAENIGVNVHYIPVYLHPYYKELGYQKGLCPNAERLYERIITLPLFPKMNPGDVKEVIEAVKKVVSYYHK